MEIRKVTINDIDIIMSIYQQARQFMIANGNNQWGETYPEKEMIEQDINKMYVCIDSNTIVAVFYYVIEEDEDYQLIKNGNWLNDLPYGVIHRIASTGLVKGAAQFCLDWAFNQCGNIRIDTYKANIPMQRLLEKCNFTNCGTIYRIGMDWLAYQKSNIYK